MLCINPTVAKQIAWTHRTLSFFVGLITQVLFVDPACETHSLTPEKAGRLWRPTQAFTDPGATPHVRYDDFLSKNFICLSPRNRALVCPPRMVDLSGRWWSTAVGVAIAKLSLLNRQVEHLQKMRENDVRAHPPTLTSLPHTHSPPPPLPTTTGSHLTRWAKLRSPQVRTRSLIATPHHTINPFDRHKPAARKLPVPVFDFYFSKPCLESD